MVLLPGSKGLLVSTLSTFKEIELGLCLGHTDTACAE